MMDHTSKRLVSLLLCALFAACALFAPAQTLAAPYDPSATLAQFIYGQSCAQFTVGKDSNAFTHTKGNFIAKYEMDAAYQNALFSMCANNSTDYARLVERFNKDWHGSCFGMSSTMSLCFLSGHGFMTRGLFASDMQSGAQNYAQITPPRQNRAALNWINFFQASHCVSASQTGAITKSRLTRYTDGKMRYANMDALVAFVVNNIDAGRPFPLAYGAANGAHAIVCCDYYFDASKNYFYIKCYDENDLGSQRAYGNQDARFCYIRIKWNPQTRKYTAPYLDQSRNEVCNIYYYNYKQGKYLPKRITYITCYNIEKIYANLEGSMRAQGVCSASADAATALQTSNGELPPGDAVLTLERINEVWENYRIRPYVYHDGDKNTLDYASGGKLIRVGGGAADVGDLESFEDIGEAGEFLPIPTDEQNEQLDFAHASGYEYLGDGDAEDEGVDLAIGLKAAGRVNSLDQAFDGYELVLSDGVLPGASLAKGEKFAWVSGESIDCVRFSSDGRLRDVYAGTNGSDLALYFGTQGELDNLDMFCFTMSDFGFLQIYDTEDDERFDGCIVLRTDGLADGFTFAFYKGALESALYEKSIGSLGEDIWIKIKPVGLSGDGQLGVSAWVQPDDGGAFIPDFPEEPIFTTRLHERESASSSGGAGGASTYGDGVTQYALKSGAQGEALADGALRFTIDAPFEKQTGVAVDGKPLQRGVDYDVTEGSTVITLKRTFLATLKDGEHTLAVNFTDGSCKTTFITPVSSATSPVAEVPATGGAGSAPTLLALAAAMLCAALRQRRNERARRRAGIKKWSPLNSDV